MSIAIEPVDVGDPAAGALLAKLDAEIEPFYPREQRFAYSVEEMRAADVRFFLARRDGEPAGCGGLERRGDLGELKRMYVDPTARGSGVADALLERIEAEARELALSAIRLETGTFQKAAIAFYRRAGFADIPPYGEYVGSPTSVCMEKRL